MDTAPTPSPIVQTTLRTAHSAHHPPVARRHTYTKLTNEEYRALGEFIRKAGFLSKTAYFTAVARISIYHSGTDYHNPPGSLDAETLVWIQHWKTTVSTEDDLRQQYFDVLTDLAFPVIAARGGQLAFHLLQPDIEAMMAERSGLVPSPDRMRAWTQAYEALYRRQLDEHRAELVREHAGNQNAPACA